MPVLADVVAAIGVVTTTTTAADQLVVGASYTVPVGRVLHLEYIDVFCRSSSPPGNSNPVLFGTISLEIAGVKRLTWDLIGNVAPAWRAFDIPNWQVAAGQIVRVVCTPIAVTSFVWRANFGGNLA
jgi:hypothetical protein